MGSAGVVLVLALAALAAPVVEAALGASAETVDLLNRFAVPSAGHPLGTDDLGRDVLVRLLYGGRVSLFVGLTAALAAAAIGTVIGLVAGYHGGRLDAVLMRFTDAIIALPLLPLPDRPGGAGPGASWDSPRPSSPPRTSASIASSSSSPVVGWTTVARLVRGAALALRERPFVLAAHAQGASGLRVMTVHILPNLASPIVVATTLSAGNVILLESVLSFLGLGIQPPIPSWGNLLTNAQELIWSAPTLAFYPGILIFVTVIAFNFLGDGLQDALDPRAAERSG